jgi:dTMP kinase
LTEWQAISLFITFEGIDGCGKSTQAGLLSEYLSRQYGSEKVLWTREPGGWPGSSCLREMLLSGELDHPWTEVFLFLADRCEHAKKIIEPTLLTGAHVLCERYDDSTLAYQVWGRGLDLGKVESAISLCGHRSPDKTILLEVSMETALKRASARSRPDRYEKEGKPFLERVREGYRFLQSREKDRFIVIDGESSPEVVFKRIFDSLEEFF